VCAPSGGNMQRWRFLVITDAEIKRTVGAYYKRAWDEQVTPRYRSGDPAPGMSRERFLRLLDAARALGLGATLTTLYLQFEKRSRGSTRLAAGRALICAAADRLSDGTVWAGPPCPSHRCRPSEPMGSGLPDLIGHRSPPERRVWGLFGGPRAKPGDAADVLERRQRLALGVQCLAALPGKRVPSELGIKRVESGCGAEAVGRACLFPPLSCGGALVARP